MLPNADQSSTDAATPSAGQTYHYLVSAKNHCGEGTLGNRKSGAPRPNSTPCGSAGRNSDADTILDIDDNCPLATNQNQADFDHAGIGDVCDVEMDNDGVANGSDCAPQDPTAFGAPTEVTGETVSGKTPTNISWTTQNIGSGTRYDLATGSIADAHANNYGPGTCLQNNAVSPPYGDTRANPAAGQGYYYMVRSQNACGTSTYGTPSRDQHGTSGGSSCP